MKEILKSHYRKYGVFVVARLDTSISGKRWYTYIKYPSYESDWMIKHEELTDRYIFPDEVVHETDMNMRRMNYGESNRICKILTRKGLSYQQWFSGNKSYHIHMYFPELSAIYNPIRRKLIKELILEWLYDSNGLFDIMPIHTPIDTINDVRESIHELMSRKKVDRQLSSKHLIRLERAYHTSTGVMKRLLNENENDYDNKIPEAVWKMYSIITSKTRYIFKSWSSTGKTYADKPCIKYFLANQHEDGRKRIAFILFNQLKRKHGAEKASKILYEWNHNMQGGHIRDGEIQSLINYHSRHDKAPGCRYIQETLSSMGRLDVCKGCKYGGKNGR